MMVPSVVPSVVPSLVPSMVPSVAPSMAAPSMAPSMVPSVAPRNGAVSAGPVVGLVGRRRSFVTTWIVVALVLVGGLLLYGWWHWWRPSKSLNHVADPTCLADGPSDLEVASDRRPRLGACRPRRQRRGDHVTTTQAPPPTMTEAEAEAAGAVVIASTFPGARDSIAFTPPPPVSPVPEVDPTIEHLDALRARIWQAVQEGASALAFPWDVLLQVGDVYYRGAFPRWKPDVDMALECYQWAARAPGGHIAGLAQAKYIEARLEGMHQDDIAGCPLDPEWGDDVCDAAEVALMLLRRGGGDFGRATAPPPPRDPRIRIAGPAPRVTPPARIMGPDVGPRWRPEAAAVNNDLWEEVPDDIGHVVAVAERGAGAPGQGDAQNVHDHAVVAFLRERVHRDLGPLPAPAPEAAAVVDSGAAAGPAWAQGSFAAVSRGLQQQWRALGLGNRGEATKVLDALGADDHYAVSISEREALRRVVQRIAQAPPSAQANLWETLAAQLASGVEAGYVVCSTGRLARIVGMLDVLDTVGTGAGGGAASSSSSSSSLRMRPLWAVQEELAQLAAKTREDALGAVTADLQEAYNQGHTTAEVGALSRDMQAQFEERVQDEYVRKLGMNPDILRPLVDTWKAEL